MERLNYACECVLNDVVLVLALERERALGSFVGHLGSSPLCRWAYFPAVCSHQSVHPRPS